MINIKKITLIILLSASSLCANSYNTDPLIARGIDPHILNLAVTPFKQKVAYNAEITYLVEKDGQKEERTVHMLFDPYTSYGIDIRLQIPKHDLDYYDKSDVKEDLDRLMGLQSYLQSERLYDQESIHYIGKTGDFETIAFRLDPKAIPRELKEYRDFDGVLSLKNDELYMIEISNTKPFRDQGIDITHFKKVLYFSKVKGYTGYLVQKTVIEVDGSKDEVPYHTVTTTNILSYWNKENEHLVLENKGETQKQRLSEAEYETIFVNLDRTLPILGQDARKEGYDLPKAYGISLITMMQNTRFYMESFEVNGHDISDLFDKSSKFENQTMISMVQFDAWILPFLNVGVMVGGADTSSNVTLGTTNRCLGGIVAPDGSCLIVDTGGNEVKIDGLPTNSIIYGFGTTLGGGVGNFFATVNLQYMTSYTKSADVKTDILVVTPMFGYYFQDYGIRVLGGGMYEDLKEYLDFNLAGSGYDNVSGRIGLRSEKWAGTLGVNYDFTRHWSSNVLVSYGKDFQNLNFVVTYRW